MPQEVSIQVLAPVACWRPWLAGARGWLAHVAGLRPWRPWLAGAVAGAFSGALEKTAFAFAEVFVEVNKVHSEEFIPELRAATACTSATVRRGFLEMIDCMPQAMKMDFVPYIGVRETACDRGCGRGRDCRGDAKRTAAK